MNRMASSFTTGGRFPPHSSLGRSRAAVLDIPREELLSVLPGGDTDPGCCAGVPIGTGMCKQPADLHRCMRTGSHGRAAEAAGPGHDSVWARHPLSTGPAGGPHAITVE